MKKIAVYPSFLHSVEKLTSQEKILLRKSLESLNIFLVSGKAPFGFRFRKLGENKYEFRVDLRLRVIATEDREFFNLVLVGGHDEIRQYLKNN